jgi:hypothetical protein
MTAMGKYYKNIIKTLDDEKGQILVFVVAFMLLITIVIPPLLSYISTSWKNREVQNEVIDYLYAADAGIEDAKWQLKYDHLKDTVPAYDEYDYISSWNYDLSDAALTGQMNGQDVDVTIQNIWIPMNIADPTYATPGPQEIVDGGRLIVTGTTEQTGINVGGTYISQYTVKITYYENAGETLRINTLGIWLPQGFTYYSDASHKSRLEDSPGAPYYKVPGTPQSWKNGTVVLWDWSSSPVAFTSLPVVTGTDPMTAEITLYYKPGDQTNPGKEPDIIAWVTTSGTGVSDIPYSLDADVRVYKINAAAGSTSVESYTAISSLRQMQSSIAGDYYATGNSNLSAVNPNHSRNQWHDPSSAAVTSSNIPADADVTAAYLYWTGWKNESSIINANQTRVPTADGAVSDTWDSVRIQTNSPANNTGSSWTNPNYTYAGDANNATITGGAPSGSNIWGNYGFDLTGATINQVRVRYDAFATPDEPITFRSAGTVASGTTGAISPGLPAGLAANDMCVLVASTIAGGSITLTGNGSIAWNALTGSPVNVASGEKLYVWWGRYLSGSTAPTLTPGSDHCIARIAAWKNVNTGASPVDVYATGTDTTWDTSFSFATGISTTANNEMCICVCSTGADTTYSQFTTMANGSLSSLTERMDNETSNGGGGGFALDEGFKSTAGSAGTWTSFLSTASTKAYICFAFKPATVVYPQIRVDVSWDGGANWSAVQNTTLTAVETAYWYDVTSAIAWTPAKLNNSNLKVRVAYIAGATMTANLDWLPVEVSYVVATTGKYAAVDETTPNDGDYITCAADAGGYALFTSPVFSVPASATITDLTIYYRARGVSWGGQNNIRAAIKVGGNVYDTVDTGQNPGTSFYTHSYSFNTNPKTGAAWTVGEINGTGANALQQFGIASNDLDPDILVSMVYAVVNYGTLTPDTSVVFTVDNPSDAPAQFTLTANKTQVVRTFALTEPHGYSYSSFCDVTALVRSNTKSPTIPPTNYPGYATYSVGGISADSSPQDEWAYACWSLVIIYISPNTQGHQLYLYDKFTNSNQDSSYGVNVDFDNDGQPGGTISGFIVPEPVAGEVNAGKISTFIGEGDVWYEGDYVAVNGTRLWDGTNTTGNSKNSPNNVFNSTSSGLGTYDGIDIDTLGIDPPNGQYITWASDILNPGDTSAQIDMVTHTDVWNLVYIIISFRSTTTSGGALSYVIH